MKKGFLFGLGIFLTGIVFAEIVSVTIPDKIEGEGFNAAEFNQIVGVLDGLHNDGGNFGIGIVPATNAKLNINGSMKLVPQNLEVSCDPSREGVVYANTDGHWYGCNGSAWKQLDN